MSDLLKEAIAGLGINVPIYRTEQEDQTLILYLYGGRVLRWPPSRMATAGRDPDPDPVTTSTEMEPAGDRLPADPVTIDNLTVIPYIGDATAKALLTEGYLTFQDLITASDADLLKVPGINTYTLPKIRRYLRTTIPLLLT